MIFSLAVKIINVLRKRVSLQITEYNTELSLKYILGHILYKKENKCSYLFPFYNFVSQLSETIDL